MQNIGKSCTTRKVICNYLAANRAKGVSNAWTVPAKGEPRIYFEEIIESISQHKEDDLKKIVGYGVRLKRLEGHHWFIKQVELKYIGGWPHVGDVLRDWCQGSVVDAANQITINPHITSKSLKKILNIVKIIDVILDFFPPILVQGGEIRKTSNLLFLPFDADDGSHRCIAAALARKKNINAYVGLM